MLAFENLSSQPFSFKEQDRAKMDMQRRRLILCCDGTQNDSLNTKVPLTNVARISRCFESVDERISGDTVNQMIFYQSGVGTGTSNLVNGLDSLSGRGKYANAHITILQPFHSNF